MRHDEQNELQEGGDAASFFGLMHLPRILGITLLLSASAWAQVSGDVSDLQAGLVAKWDEVMPLDTEKILRLPADTEGMKLEDFAVAFAFQVEKAPDMEHGSHILALINESESGLLDWHLGTTGFSIKLEGRGFGHPVSVSQPMEGRWWQVVLNVKRDARQALSGIWVNGVEMNSWREAPGPIFLTKALFDPCSRGLGGQIANLRLYNRALTRPEIFELAAMPTMASLKPKLSPFPGSMKLMTEEGIAVLGGTEAVVVMEDGTMEALMLTQFPGSRVKMRSLAWEADTVFRQDRPMNFGGLKQQLLRSGATAAMLMFGRQECLERGEAGLAEFRAALEKLVTLCAEVTPRLALVEPPAFEAELSKHNATLKKYAAVMAEVAKAHGALFAAQDGGLKPGSTRDGLNLTSTGAAQLGMSVAALCGGDVKAPDGRLKTLIGEKNRLWHRYWRPANWAFLHGDRTAQPSSRDHVDPTLRWFPSELEHFKPLIEAKENELWKLANDLGGKLP
ncbi:MAG: hypothetical protein ACKVY0_14780 [Prosthecobacter sp.]|uniref:hypothetical protein n=1 Tax=Prosthecobacter sp. TaxID=1965333 RepID=UPI0039017B41